MRNAMMALALSWMVPVAASASHDVNVDIRVLGGSGWDAATYVEFEADRSGFVALYATFSDGSIVPIFPVSDCESHWVNRRDVYSVPVWVPRGVRVETVQVVASDEWFDPTETWVASAPYYGNGGPQWVVTTSYRRPLSTWAFSLSWGNGHDACRVVRHAIRPSVVIRAGNSGWHAGWHAAWTWRSNDRGWRDRYGSYDRRGNDHGSYSDRDRDRDRSHRNDRGTVSTVKVKGSNQNERTGRDGAANPSRWTSGGWAKTKQVKATPGKKSSKS
ncbi:MAG: hypothetical protein KC591_15145 [Gemmatimonadetes bacterium]|nr:hypothetical protein [Gemmatimonadota bacterium]